MELLEDLLVLLGGAIFKDYNGDCLVYTAEFYGNQDALFVELNAAITTIQFANSNGWNAVWLEYDSSIMVDIFKGKHKPPWKLLNKWLLLKATMEGMDCIVSHIYREGNSCADKLVNYGINSKTNSS
ncbi:PREDICTED: uncharacterized protein LOC109358584 [Lupinus angustifolius]|uniref:uncharacterized protein LOC109358584 n=1 Tax=Lupinus angustifolius TaxID=3871 RepID=UPI00092E68FB|nr:PREDICTED: uncharacterized protein LOC109358584 [Lupinus angustifolius]